MNSKWKKWAILTLSVLVVAVGAFDLWVHYNQNRKTPAPVLTPTPSATPVLASQSYPLAINFPSHPMSSPGRVVVKVFKGTASTNTQHTLTIAGEPITTFSGDCSVQNDQDVCFVGRAGQDGANVSIFYVKNILASRLFENPTTFKKVSVIGSPSAGTFTVDANDGKHPTLAISTKDSSGWVIFGTAAQESQISALIPKITVS